MLPFFLSFFENKFMIPKLIEYLSSFVSENRSQAFNRVIDWRTRYLTVVLEDIYQAQNASAVLRTCDCFGIQDVHIIENSNEYTINPDVSLGSNQWLNLYRYNQKKNNTQNTIQQLKAKGYRIVATSPHKNDLPLEQFDLTKGKTALLFGTELHGLSNDALKLADEFLKIPMFGFTESFNISVSAAIILYNLSFTLRSNSNINWKLSSIEQNEILLQWYKNTIKDSEGVIQRFMDQENI